MCVCSMCMCVRSMCMCVRSMCMCVRSMCMCVRSMCMCVEQRAVISRIVAYVWSSVCVSRRRICVCVCDAGIAMHVMYVCVAGHGCGCRHRVGGAVDSVRCMDVVSSTAIGVDCGWMVDGRVALPAIDG